MSNQKHSDLQLNESLSALMDGEASELELRRLLKSDDPAILQQWSRMHIAREAMQGKDALSASMNLDFSASISAAIAEEPVYSGTQSSAKASQSNKTGQSKVASLWSNMGRFAVAASVAGAVVMGVQFVPGGDAHLAGSDAQPSQSQATPASSPVLAPDTRLRAVGNQGAVQEKQIIINEETHAQLKKDIQGEVERLMLEHAQDGTHNTPQGVLPYVRVPESEQ